ncbi:hypothetical protein PTKIN_Ptkin11bG0026000 [Pterospermum kingtungense]
MRSGKVVKVMVSVPWMSLKCSKCNIFGHANQNCAKKDVQVVNQKWIPKNKIDKGFTSTKGNEFCQDGKLVETVTDMSSKVSNSQGKAGSVGRFSILNDGETLHKVEKIAGDKEVKVALSFEENSKGLVEDSIVVVIKGSVQSIKSVDKGKAIAVEEDNISEDSYDEFHGLSQNSRKKSLIDIGSIRPQRLTAAGVKEAMRAVKARNRKCRRQAKQVSASKTLTR